MPALNPAPPIDLAMITGVKARLCTEAWRRYFRALAALTNFLTTTLATLGATVAALPVTASGVYTPTLTGLVNVAAATAYPMPWLRVGTTVTVAGRIDVDATALVDTQLGVSLPVASALAAVNQLGGAGADETGVCAVAIYADAANDRATLRWLPATVVNRGYTVTFSYQVL